MLQNRRWKSRQKIQREKYYSERGGFSTKLARTSDIEAKKNHVAFLHNVVLALQPCQALFARGDVRT
jgi:hypothetical protein